MGESRRRRDFNSATTERRVKYTEILNFSLFSRHFAFNVHKHGYREKVLKTTRMVRLLDNRTAGHIKGVLLVIVNTIQYKIYNPTVVSYFPSDLFIGF